MKRPAIPFVAVVMTTTLLLFGAGCDGFLDINEDPNNPTEVPVSALLSNVSFYTGNNVFSLGDVTANYVQYIASPNPASSSDIQERVSYDGAWSGLYNIMTDLSILEEQAAEQGANAYLGIAKILKALHLGLTVDMWGDVPYSEAFSAETLNPTYDEAEQLYLEVFQLLDDGIAALEQGNFAVAPGNDDFIYGGDIDLWIKTGHALKARYLNHLSETAQYDPQAVLAEVDLAYESYEENATVDYFEDEINPWADVAIANAGLILGGWLSEQIIQALDGTTYGVMDPRIESYTDSLADSLSTDPYVGTENGAGRGDAPAAGARCVLTTNTFYAQPTSPIEIITYAEVKFIEAEAALRSGQRQRAYAAYLEGIRAHMNKLGVDPAARDAYVGHPSVSVGAGALTIDDVFREKYKVMFLNPEAWVDARRYEYQYENMTLPENHNPALNGQFIRRLDYPDSEYGRNAGNVPDVTLLTRIFWDTES